MDVHRGGRPIIVHLRQDWQTDDTMLEDVRAHLREVPYCGGCFEAWPCTVALRNRAGRGDENF